MEEIRLPLAVRAGVELLDCRRPGWREKIDQGWLKMESGKRCVLGQLFGSFLEGSAILNLLGADCERHGFRLPNGRDDSREYALLTELWLDAIGR